MGTIQTKQGVLDYVTSIENNRYLGLIEKVNLNQKSPITLPNMRRKNLARLFRKLGYKVGVEIGVARGIFSEILCKCNPKMKLYSIDPYKVYDDYPEDYSKECMKKRYKEAKERLANYNCKLVRKYSMNAIEDFDDESLDFVHIDGNHEFQFVTNDIAEWSKKVRTGGIISGHDFTRYKGNPNPCHVKDVVSAWAYSHKIKPWFVLRGEHGASWFWVKE